LLVGYPVRYHSLLVILHRENNPDVQAFMSDNDISSREELDGYFFLKVVSILDSLNAKYITVEQTYFNTLTLSNSTVVQVWWAAGLDSLAAVGFFLSPQTPKY
jgi:hypothetical protein